MKSFPTLWLAGALMTSLAAAPGATLDFQEVYQIVRTNLTGVSEADLQAAAARGFVDQLNGRALLLTNAPTADAPDLSRPAVAVKSRYEEAFAYVRLAHVGQGAGAAFSQALGELQAQKPVQGLILDLRFASGTNYTDAAAVAEVLLPDERALFSVEGRVHRVTGKNQLGDLPVALLVNRRTAGAAEALAAGLRAARIGLILGDVTAGAPALFKDFKLSTGQVLRVVTAEIHLGDGSVMPVNGVRPDIKVEVGLLDEQLYLADAYRELNPPRAASAGTTNAVPPRRMINEAELVRRHREGQSPADDVVTAKPALPAQAQVRDPALARALDLLKALTVVRAHRRL